MPLLIRRLRALMRPRDKWRALALVIPMAVGTLLELVGIGLVMPAVAALTKPELLEQNAYLRAFRRLLGDLPPKGFVLATAGVIVLAYILKGFYQLWLTRRQARFALGLAADLSDRLFEYYLDAPYAFHLRRNSVECINNLVRVSTVFVGAMLPVLMILSESLVLAGMCCVLLVFAPLMSLGVVAVSALALAAGYLPFKRLQERLGHTMIESGNAGHAIVAQALGGLKEIKVLGRAPAFVARHAVCQRLNKKVITSMQTMNQIPRFFIETFMVVVVMGALAVSVFAGVADGTILLRFSLLAVFAMRAMPSLSRIQYALSSARQNIPALEYIQRDLDEVHPPPPPSPRPPLVFEKKLELSGLRFAYPGMERPVLDDISLVIPHLSATAFVGPTGGGKTTMVDLILGLLEPTSGAVLVDGRDIRENLASWQRTIGYVPQNIFLLDGAVAENVAFGLPKEEIDRARVEEALRVAQAWDFVSELPEGMDTPVGEGGSRLSGGQRQRVAIARALYARPSLLVLDEATSALDLDTERAFVDALRNLRGSITIIVVAHRPATVRTCDRALRVADGRVSEAATLFE